MNRINPKSNPPFAPPRNADQIGQEVTNAVARALDKLKGLQKSGFSNPEALASMIADLSQTLGVSSSALSNEMRTKMRGKEALAAQLQKFDLETKYVWKVCLSLSDGTTFTNAGIATLIHNAGFPMMSGSVAQKLGDLLRHGFLRTIPNGEASTRYVVADEARAVQEPHMTDDELKRWKEILLKKVVEQLNHGESISRTSCIAILQRLAKSGVAIGTSNKLLFDRLARAGAIAPKEAHSKTFILTEIGRELLAKLEHK